MAKREILKFGWRQYWRPTPLRLRRLGDSLLGVSVFMAGAGWEHPRKSLVVLVLGIAGKFLSNFYSTEKQTE
jgi:hypothetical protein